MNFLIGKKNQEKEISPSQRYFKLSINKHKTSQKITQGIKQMEQGVARFFILLGKCVYECQGDLLIVDTM